MLDSKNRIMKCIDVEKLKAEIERLVKVNKELKPNRFTEGIAAGYGDVLSAIASLQQEKLKDKQIIIITESHGDANMDWDCRSLDDVIVLLKSAESFITEKQIEELRGQGSGPDYNTIEGRYNHLFKHKQEQPDTAGDDGKFVKILVRKEIAEQIQRLGDKIQAGQTSFIEAMNQQEQPDVDLEKEIDDWYNTMGIPVTVDALKETARHFYELGKNARKEDTK